MRGRCGPAPAGSLPCSRVHKWQSSGLPVSDPDELPGADDVLCRQVDLGGYGCCVVVGWWRWAPPRTTNRRHRPHSGLSLTHSTPGDHTLMQPPGHWLRPHLSTSHTATRNYLVLGLNRSTDPQLPPRAGFFSSKWPLGMPRGGGTSNPGLFGLDGALCVFLALLRFTLFWD